MRSAAAAKSPAGGDGPWPALIVGFEMFGLTPYVRRTADRLAGLGPVAVVPDLYDRAGPRLSGAADERGRAHAYDLLTGLTRKEVTADLLAIFTHPGQPVNTARPSPAGPPGAAGNCAPSRHDAAGDSPSHGAGRPAHRTARGCKTPVRVPLGGHPVNWRGIVESRLPATAWPRHAVLSMSRVPIHCTETGGPVCPPNLTA